MTSRFFWFLGSLLALLFCHGAANTDDIQILQEMKEKVEEYFPETNGGRRNQFAVLHLPGKDVRDCHEIRFNNPTGVDGHCNFASVFHKEKKQNRPTGHSETIYHSEWQLIHTALEPMLEEWKAGNARMKRGYGTKGADNKKKGGQAKRRNSGNTKKENGAGDGKGGGKRRHIKANCPEALYLYTRLAPDYDCRKRYSGYTCTQAIVTTIPEILKNGGCEATRIVVGFSKVNKTYKIEACEGYQCMKENNVEEYHLEEDMEDTCRGVIFLKPTNCTYIINRALS